MESFGELIIEARKKAQKSKSKDATVTMKGCTCSATVSYFSKLSSLETHEKCYDHEDRPRVLAARRAS